MNKRITSLLLCFVMVFAMLATAVPALAAPIESTQLKVTADKTSAQPGDTITFTITMGPVSDMGSMQMCLDVPTGLTYVANSTELATGLKETLGFDLLDWTEVSKMINGGASAADYESNSDTEIATFKCTVNEGFSGTAQVGLTNLEFGSCQTFEYHTDRFSVVKATVNITPAPVAVTGVTIDKTLSVSTGESKTLNYTVDPADATNKAVSFASSDSSVATVDATGTVTGVKKGNAVITIKTADGNFTATCAVTVNCGHGYGHDVPAKASTCIEHGHAAYTVCDECGEIIAGSDAELSLAEHSYTEKVDAKYLKSAATCVSKAVYYKSCSVCGKKGTETFEYGELDLNNHTGDTYLKDQKEATCYEEGYTGDTYCNDCNIKIKDGTVIAKSAHNPASVWSTDETDHWKECQTVGCGNIIDKAPHCGGEATCVDKAVCSVCHVQYGEIDESNHKHTEIRDAEEATCTKEGFTGDTWCTDCNKPIIDGEVIPKTPHNYKDEVVAPTCEDEGYTVHTCNCGHKVIDTYTDALGHKVVEWTVTKKATAEESGTKTGNCTVCGEEITVETGKLVDKVENDSAKVEAVGDTTLYVNLILKTDKMGDKLSDTDKADMQAKIEALKLAVENIKMAEIFDISLFLRDTDASGNPIQDLKYEPNGKIRITMEVPEAIFKNFKNVKLLHFLDDGTVETVDYILDGSKAVFDTESLSYFAFAGTPVVTDTGTTNDNGTKNENNGQSSSPKTGDRSNPIVWIAVLLVSALTVGTVSVYNRKRNCRAFKK